MGYSLRLPQNITAILVYGRVPLTFAGLLSALGVMWTESAFYYVIGILFLFTSMCFDLIDGWFSARFSRNPALAHLADKIMDKLVYCIIFPLLAFGEMWRLYHNENVIRVEKLHAIFILILCISVLVRDNFANFMRGFAFRAGQESEPHEFTRLRTTIAAPVAAILYAHAFYISEGHSYALYSWISLLGKIPIQLLFIIEIIFLIINFGSIARYTQKYGKYCLNELCLGNELLRRKILSFFPNSLTVMNALMGLLAVFFAYQDRVQESYLIIVGAAFFDKLDGAMARKLGLTQPLNKKFDQNHISFGGILDDISDMVSFCIAPSWIFYIIFSDISKPAFPWPHTYMIIIFYAAMGALRLIYFTLDKKPIPGFFKGLPTPAAALLVLAPIVIFSHSIHSEGSVAIFWEKFCYFWMVFIGFMMNLYPVRYIHLGRFMDRSPIFLWTSILLLIGFMFTPFFGHAALTYMSIYLLSPLITWRISPQVAARETRSNYNQ